MSCEAAGIDGSSFVSKKRPPAIQGEQDSRLRQINPACVEAALTERDWGEVPARLRQSLQAAYEQEIKK